MLFIPIDVLNMKPKFHQTSGLNHVAWFILHCLVFREQSLVLSNRAAHLSDLFSISRWVFSVKNFLKFFLTEFGTDMFQSLASQGFAGSHRVPYLSATCIMIHVFSSYVNTFFHFLHVFMNKSLTASISQYSQGSIFSSSAGRWLPPELRVHLPAKLSQRWFGYQLQTGWPPTTKQHPPHCS